MKEDSKLKNKDDKVVIEVVIDQIFNRIYIIILITLGMLIAIIDQIKDALRFTFDDYTVLGICMIIGGLSIYIVEKIKEKIM